LSVAVPVGGLRGGPLTNVDGVTEKVVNHGALTVIVAWRLTAPCVAVIVTVVDVADCKSVAIENEPLEAPAIIVTVGVVG